MPRSPIPDEVWALAAAVYKPGVVGSWKDAAAVITQHGHSANKGQIQKAMERRGAVTGILMVDPPSEELTDEDVARVVTHERQLESLRREATTWKRKYEEAIKGDSLDHTIADLMREYRSAMPVPKLKGDSSRTPKLVRTKESICLLLSDLHVGETVSAEAMHGINRYDIDVFMARMERLAELVEDICFDHLTGYEFEELVIYGLGDLVNGMFGAMHDELIVTQAADLMETVYGLAYVLVQFMARMRRRFARVRSKWAPGNHGRMCFDTATELLTRRGWLLWYQIEATDEIGTLNPDTHGFEWQALENLHVFPFDGTLVSFANTQVNLCVTGEHDLYTRLTGSENRGYRYPFAKRKAAERRWGNRWRGLGAATQWNGTCEDVVIPGTKLRPSYVITPSPEFAEFLGWFVSEGVAGKGPNDGGRITICQSQEKNPKRYDRIVELITSLGYKPSCSATYIRFSDAPLSAWLKTNFGINSHDKRVPQWLMDWPSDLLRAFVHGIFEGGGHWLTQTNGHITTTSEQLSDDLQQIAIKLGWSSTASKRYVGEFKGQGYWGSARKVRFRTNPEVAMGVASQRAYCGTVWCPEVENGLVFVRRNGQVIASGNSRKPWAKGASLNWDMVVPQIVSSFFAGDATVEFDIPDSFFFVDEIRGQRVLGFHGHQVKGWSGIPWYGIKRFDENLTGALAKVGVDIDHIVMGHFHTEAIFDRVRGEIVANPCFVPGTPITMFGGVRKPIESITAGEYVLTHTGAVRQVTEAMVRPYDGDVTHLRLGSEASDVIATPEHPFLAIKGQQVGHLFPQNGAWSRSFHNPNPRWIKARDLSVGDFVQISCPDLPRERADEDVTWARLLGLSVAECSLTSYRTGGPLGRVAWHLHRKEEEYAQFIKNAMLSRGYSAKDAFKGANGRTIVVNSTALAELLFVQMGRGAAGKHLFDEVWTWSVEERRALLIGWLEGDGHVNHKNKRGGRVVSGCSISRKLIEQLHDLAMSCGYCPTLFKLSKGGPRKQDSYSLGFGGDDAGDLAARMGQPYPPCADLPRRILRVGGQAFREITHAWTEYYSGPVFNLEVESDHSYTANGLSVHNCMKGADEFTLSAGFRPAPAGQTMFGMHEDHGITHRWRLDLQNAYEPTGVFEWWPGGTLGGAMARVGGMT